MIVYCFECERSECGCIETTTTELPLCGTCKHQPADQEVMGLDLCNDCYDQSCQDMGCDLATYWSGWEL